MEKKNPQAFSTNGIYKASLWLSFLAIRAVFITRYNDEADGVLLWFVF